MRIFSKMLGVSLLLSILFIASTTTATTNQETSSGPQPKSRPVTGAALGSRGSSATHCPVERALVKDSADSDWNRVDLTPVPATIAALNNLAAPDKALLRAASDVRFEPELHVYTVQGYLVGFKLENDLDFHIVIADLDDPTITMIVEMVSPVCLAMPFKQEAKGLRTSWEARFGKATPRFKRLPQTVDKVKVEITGVGFYDFLHGQTGVAKNGFELHRVLAWMEVDNRIHLTPGANVPTAEVHR